MQLKTLLVLANRTGNENLRNFQVDETVAKQLMKSGWRIEERSIGEATVAHLAAADVVVLLQTPYTTNIEGTQEWQRFQPVLRQWLENGGGLLVFHDERYFQVMPGLDSFFEPLGLRVLKEAFDDTVSEHLATLDNSPEMERLLTTNIAKDHPVTDGINSLWIPTGEDRTCAFPMVLSSNWTPLVSAEKSARSYARWTDESSSISSEPPVVAARRVGDGGRLVYIGAHSMFTFLHGSSRRWDDGFFLRTGWQNLIDNALSWLAEAPSVGKGAMPPAIPSDHSLFAAYPLEKQHPVSWWQSGLVVRIPGVPENLEEWVTSARKHLDWLALAIPGKDLDSEGYRQWVASCEALGDENFQLIPALQIEDMFENKAVLLKPDKWPITRKLGSLNHILHDVSGHMILVDVQTNPWKPWNIGGFHGLAVEQKPADKWDVENLSSFGRLQDADWFLIPHSVFAVESEDQLAGLLEQEPARLYVAATSPSEVITSLPRLFHNERQAFLSNGPVLEQFQITGPSVINDPWEGLYTLWRGPKDRGILKIRLRSDHALKFVSLYRQGRLWRQYIPDAKAWSLDLELESDQGTYSIWLEAYDEAGGRLLSTTERTRAASYWTHGGGDRMNTYDARVEPHPHGELSVRKQTYSAGGGVLFGLGWGDWVRPMPAISGHETPAGRELGAPAGGLWNTRFIPQISLDGQLDFGVSKPERTGYDTAHEEVAILREHISHMEKLDHGIRRSVPSHFIEASNTYTMPRWEHGGTLMILMETTISPRRTLHLQEPTTMTLMETVAHDDRWFAHVATADPDANAVQQWSIHDDAALLADSVPVHTWAAMWPDPRGAIALAPLDDHPYSIRVTPSSKGPRLRWDTTLPAGEWNAPITFRYALLLVHPNVTNVTEYVDNNTTALRNIDLTTLYPGTNTLFDASKELVSASLKAPDGVARLVRIRNTGSGPAFVRAHPGAELRPMAHDGTDTLFTIPAGQTWDFVAGSLAQCDRTELVLDTLQHTDETLQIWVHNPGLEAIEANLEPTSLWGKGERRRIIVQPGQDQLVVWSKENSR